MFIFRRVAQVLFEESVIESAQYAKENMKKALIMFDEGKSRMFDYATECISKDGHIAEFGIWEGKSVNYIAKRVPEKTVYAFDSMEGLKVNWEGYEWQAGSFAVDNIEHLETNIEFTKGWFDESLPGWLEEHPGEFSFIHIDSDTYESANTILTLAGPERINSGTVILFGEYFGYPNWREHQFKAWQEFVTQHNINYEYLCINRQQVLLRVL
jgi:hypothetical protein